MIQQGQVFKLKAKGADGQPLWAYRYRRLELRERREHREFPPRCIDGSRTYDEHRCDLRPVTLSPSWD